MVDLDEHSNNPAVIDSGDQDGEKIGEQRRLLLEVEGEGLVVSDGQT